MVKPLSKVLPWKADIKRTLTPYCTTCTNLNFAVIIVPRVRTCTMFWYACVCVCTRRAVGGVGVLVNAQHAESTKNARVFLRESCWYRLESHGGFRNGTERRCLEGWAWGWREVRTCRWSIWTTATSAAARTPKKLRRSWEFWGEPACRKNPPPLSLSFPTV